MIELYHRGRGGGGGVGYEIDLSGHGNIEPKARAATGMDLYLHAPAETMELFHYTFFTQ